MFQSFKWSKWCLYIGAGVLGLIIGISYVIFDGSLISLIIYTFIGVFFFIMSLELFAQRYYKKHLKLLVDNCEAREYLGFLSQKATASPFALLELSRAFLCLGDYQQSIAYADEAKRKLDPRPRKAYWSYYFLYNNFRFDCAINLKQLDMAAWYLAETKRIIAENPASVTTSYALTVLINDYALRVASGDYDGAEIFYLVQLETETQLLSRVGLYWSLGELYIKLNQPEKARTYLEFVVQNGRTTHFVVKAQALLQQIVNN